jgi:hypothetical protein
MMFNPISQQLLPVVQDGVVAALNAGLPGRDVAFEGLGSAAYAQAPAPGHGRGHGAALPARIMDNGGARGGAGDGPPAGRVRVALSSPLRTHIRNLSVAPNPAAGLAPTTAEAAISAVAFGALVFDPQQHSIFMLNASPNARGPATPPYACLMQALGVPGHADPCPLAHMGYGHHDPPVQPDLLLTIVSAIRLTRDLRGPPASSVLHRLGVRLPAAVVNAIAARAAQWAQPHHAGKAMSPAQIAEMQAGPAL